MRKEGYIPAEYAKKPVVKILARMFRDTKGSDFVEKRHPLLYKAYVAFLNNDPVDKAVREERGGKNYKSPKAGFIGRMMGEVSLKHDGEYRKPTKPLSKESTMKSAVPFDYRKLATPDQGGDNEEGEGASSWVIEHFGTASAKKKLAAKRASKAPKPAEAPAQPQPATGAKSAEDRLKDAVKDMTVRQRKTLYQRIKYYETGDYGKRPDMEKLSREDAIKKALRE
jgi:hypothetical protein